MVKPDNAYDPYDTLQALQTVQAFRYWAENNTEIFNNQQTSSTMAEFQEWLEGLHAITHPSMPFGMHFQAWPMTLPSMRGYYDPLQQIWVPHENDLDVTRYATQRITEGLTLDNKQSTTRVVTFCFVIVPDDYPCESDFEGDR
jgi:hypothetical protein